MATNTSLQPPTGNSHPASPSRSMPTQPVTPTAATRYPSQASHRRSGQGISPHGRVNSQGGPPPMVSGWQNFSLMAVRAFNVPDDVTTYDLWRSLESVATVISIDLFENRMGERSGFARILMEPPTRNHWHRRKWTIYRPNKRPVTIKVDVDAMGFRCKAELVDSPIGRPVPALVELSVAAIQFGIMHQKTTMMNMMSIDTPQEPKVCMKMAVDFKKRQIVIYFSLQLRDITFKKHTPCTYSFKLEIKFSRLTQLIRQVLPSERWAVVISLPHPPPVSRMTTDVESTHPPERLYWQRHEMWHRQSNIMYDPRVMKETVVSLRKPEQLIDIGRWTTYRLELDKEASKIWAQVEEHLGDFNIRTKIDPDFQLVDRAEINMWDILDPPQHTEVSNESALSLLGNSVYIGLPFKVRYQLEVCLSRGMLNEHNIDAAFIQKLAGMPANRARDVLEAVADANVRVFNPMDIFSDPNITTFFSTLEETEGKKDYLVLVRKAIVTPSTVYFSTPVVETNNRVLRKYKDLKDRFLRVQFTDELPEGPINSAADIQRNDELFTRIFRVLLNGIRIGDRHYQLLAFGNSQFRENGAYFFAPTDHVSCDDIRSWMGDFSTIKNVAKYAARLGQCFSTTRLISGFRTPRVVPIEDVERDRYCFTDGVGKISEMWAQMISHHLGRDETFSAFQFRMGGCKGVLTVWPDAKAEEVHIRPSQEKFRGAIFNGLEVIRCSETATATLNQQSILILSSLGVSDGAFHDLLDKEIKGIESAVQSQQEAVVELSKRIDENQTTVTMAKMVLSGFMYSNEPFMWSLLQLWRSWSLKFLKEKAKISVEESAFVLGCVDETDTLRGHQRATETNQQLRQSREHLPQIFLQIPERLSEDPQSLQDGQRKGPYKVITGLCLVGRNPSLHPGDIRVVEAVDVPALRHLRDVVVFPRKGDRDLPGMCSGGDLDGDDFFVIWNKTLIPPESEWNYPPMDFTPPPVSQVDGRQVTLRDMCAFFVIYMKNDSLPHIAVSHRAHADRLDTGAKHPNCLRLAELHSKAVDYVKSGVPAEMPKRLSPRQFPHWMEKKTRKQYHSGAILGQLYDKVQTADFNPVYDKPFDERILRRYTLDNDMLKKARRVKNQYDLAMRRLMGQREIGTEFEVWSGFILTKPRVGTDYKLSEDIGRESSVLKMRFRDICIQEAGGKLFEHLGPFAAAMYKVTQEEVVIALHERWRARLGNEGRQQWRKIDPRAMPLISFPWLFDRELGQIATGSDEDPNVQAPPASLLPVSTSMADSEPDINELKEIDFVRNADGSVTHRGEPLTLFRHQYEDEEECAGGGVSQGSVVEFTSRVSEDTRSPSDAANTGSPSDATDGESASTPVLGTPHGLIQLPVSSVSSSGLLGDSPDKEACRNPKPRLNILQPTVLHSSVLQPLQPTIIAGMGPCGTANDTPAPQDVPSLSSPPAVTSSSLSSALLAGEMDECEEFEIEEDDIVLPQENILVRAARLFGGDE